jgi:salicylate hydroxylase
LPYQKVTTAGVYGIVLQVYDPEDWPHGRTSVVPATRTELLERLSGWGPHVRELVALVPEQFTKWGVFDMADPTPTFAVGRVCIAGDAAHASPPTLACGATIGIEDALALVELLSAAGHTGPVGGDRSRSIEAALKVYSGGRMERGLWVVRAARRMADVLQWRDGQVGKNDEAAFLAAYEKNTRKIWDVDEDAMVDEVRREFEKIKAS